VKDAALPSGNGSENPHLGQSQTGAAIVEAVVNLRLLRPFSVNSVGIPKNMKPTPIICR